MLPKVVGLTSSIEICNKKVNLVRNKAFYQPIFVITFRISQVCQNWDKLRAHVQGVNLYHLYVSPGTLKISVSITIDFFRFSQGFVNKPMFGDVLLNSDEKFFHRIWGNYIEKQI